MSHAVACKVKERSGSYFTNKVNGEQASCTAGPEQAVHALARKLFPGRQYEVRKRTDQQHWTITPEPIFNTITFSDQGQDFTEWVLKDGYVVDSKPFQGWVWVGCEVKIFDKVVFVRRPASDKYSPLNYPAKSVSETNPSYVQGFMAFECGLHETPQAYQGDEQYQFGYNVAKSLST